MLTRITKIVVAVFLAVFFSPLTGGAQEIPSLPSDNAITKGVLPNGVHYFLAANKTTGGLVEYALVRKLPEDVEVSEVYQDTLASRFGERPVGRFLAGNGFAYGSAAGKTTFSTRGRRKGSATQDAQILRFGEIHNSRGAALSDSTLLLMFTLIERDSWKIPTSANAIVLAGDIDRNAVLNRLKLISMFLPSEGSDLRPREYVWTSSDSASCQVVADPRARFTSIKAIYSTSRQNPQMMSTVLPLVSERLGDIMGLILKKRIREAATAAGIPVGFITYEYIKSSDQGGDERYEICIHTRKDFLPQATEVLAGVLSQMNEGVSEGEFADARAEYLMNLYSRSKAPRTSNSSYVDRCISAFLYGADLASYDDRFKFFVRTKVDMARQCSMFNRFVAGLVDSTANLTLAVRSDSLSVSPEEVLGMFKEGWKRRPDCSYVMSSSLKLAEIPPVPCKAKTTKKDPVTGGTMWAFDNGMNVIYKRMTTGGIFYYSLAVRGGYSAMEDIRPGEGAFLSDMLQTCYIAGMPSRSFDVMLRAAGIEMSSKVSLTDTRISGYAPRPSLELMLRSLLAVANDRKVDTTAFAYLRSCETLRLASMRNARSDRVAKIDSLMCPGYLYSPMKKISSMSEDLPLRAGAFFDEMFSRANDGILMIVGDMEETQMRKLLQNYVGAFKTSSINRARKPLNYQPLSGTLLYTDRGNAPSADVAYSSQFAFSAENEMACRIASYALQDLLQTELCGDGIHVRVSLSLDLQPQERVNLLVSADFAEGEPSAVLKRLEDAVAHLASSQISATLLAVYKKMAIDEIACAQNDPTYWISAAMLRHLDGKDLTTKYANKVNSITAAQVKEVFAALEKGGRIEYIVK